MFTACQSAAETIHRIKTGGKQTVVVKHIQITQVGEGGQAVIAGKVKAGRVRTPRGAK
jgi:hypothetical protein